jgi:hypothetical protein
MRVQLIPISSLRAAKPRGNPAQQGAKALDCHGLRPRNDKSDEGPGM